MRRTLLRAWGLLSAFGLFACDAERPIELFVRARAALWTTVAAPSAAHTGGALLALPDGRVVLAGGTDTASVDVWSPTSGTWSPASPMASARGGAAAYVDGSGRVVVAGGVGGGGPSLACEAWSPSTGLWSACASLPAAAGSAGSVADGGRLYVVGGGASGDAVRLFDGASWSSYAALNVPRVSPAVAAVGGRIFVLGGIGTTGAIPLASVERFDPSTHLATVVASMPAAVSQPRAAVLPSGVIVVASSFSGDAYLYDPTADTWTTSTPPSALGSVASVVTLASGPVLAAQSGATATFDGTIWTAYAASGFSGAPSCVALPLDGALCFDGTTARVFSPTPDLDAGPADASFDVVTVDDAITTSDSKVPPPPDTTVEEVDAADSAADAAPDSVPDSGPDSAADSAAESAPDSAADSASDATPDSAADSAPDSAPDAAPDSTPCPVPDGAFEVSADAPAPHPDGAPTVAVDAKPCVHDRECASGHCVEGVCCDSPCTEPCHSCALFGSAGRCTLEPLGVDLKQECGPALACLGTCNGAGACIGAGPGTQCARSRCTGPAEGAGPAFCAAAGVPCPTDEATEFDCTPFACEYAFGACHTSCATSGDCAPGYVCETVSARCVAVAPETASNDGCGCATPGNENGPAHAGFASACALGLAAALRRRRARPSRR
jgi:hypothetical protein